jgi:hypothetical protein
MTAAAGLRRAVRGLGEAAFRERSGTGEACRAALFRMRWREGLACPACGGRGFRELKARKVLRCDRCKRRARLTAGAVFQDAKLPPTTWFAAIRHPTRGEGGISSVELGRRLGVERGTAWPMRRELTRAMAAREATGPEPEGRVEIDDAYLGGERSGGERGRGAAGETPFVAAVEATAERKPRRLRLAVAKGFREEEVGKLAERDLAAGGAIVGDGLACRPAVAKAGCERGPIVTGSGKRVAAAGHPSAGSAPPSATSRQRSSAPAATSARSTRSRASPASPTASTVAVSSTPSSGASPGPPCGPPRGPAGSSPRTRETGSQAGLRERRLGRRGDARAEVPAERAAVVRRAPGGTRRGRVPRRGGICGVG